MNEPQKTPLDPYFDLACKIYHKFGIVAPAGGKLLAAGMIREFNSTLEIRRRALREALEKANKELNRLFIAIPVSGSLPSPNIMQDVAYALQADDEMGGEQ